MTPATKSVRFGAAKERDSFQPGKVRLNRSPGKMDVHVEVVCSILPRPVFFWHPTHIPLLDLTNGNFPEIKINTWG